MEPGRQDMDQEATDKLIGRELHGFETFMTLGPIVLPFKGNGMLVIIDDAVI